jgi:hypothetical protein
MKNIISLLTLLILSSNLAYSEELESELMLADEDYTIRLLWLCQGYSQDDEITQTDLNSYLLKCINNELEAGYYKHIKVLPKEEQ